MLRHQEHVAARGEVREQAAILDDVADAAAQLGRVDSRSTLRPPISIVPLSGCEQADDQPEDGRFPAAARSDEDGRLARFERRDRADAAQSLRRIVC